MESEGLVSLVSITANQLTWIGEGPCRHVPYDDRVQFVRLRSMRDDEWQYSDTRLVKNRRQGGQLLYSAAKTNH